MTGEQLPREAVRQDADTDRTIATIANTGWWGTIGPAAIPMPLGLNAPTRRPALELLEAPLGGPATMVGRSTDLTSLEVVGAAGAFTARSVVGYRQ